MVFRMPHLNYFLVFFFLTSCSTIHRSGKMVESIGGAIEDVGDQHSESILGKGASFGGRIYKHVGRAIQTISSTGKNVSTTKTFDEVLNEVEKAVNEK